MKATGIVRRIDDLGRVVIPKEIRRTMRIREGDAMEIFTDREGQVILKKYSSVKELAEFAEDYAGSLSRALGCLVCICDTNRIIAVSGNGRKGLQDKEISKELEHIIKKRGEISAEAGNREYVEIVEDQTEQYQSQMIAVICSQGDAVGAVVLLGKEERKLAESDWKMALFAAGFLGKQLEA